jgi:predicted nucleic acid-binding protein
VIVHLDTSVLIDALTGPRRSLPRLVDIVEQGHRIAMSSLVLFEWLRGPRQRAELTAQERLLPREQATAFAADEAAMAAELDQRLSRPRGREIDLAIAAAALAQGAALWTLNPEDFRDIPGLTLLQPSPRLAHSPRRHPASITRGASTGSPGRGPSPSTK